MNENLKEWDQTCVCRECGNWIDFRYTSADRMRERELCFKCLLWTERLETFEASDQIVANDVFGRGIAFYGIGPAGVTGELRGFGGRRWIITHQDGSTSTTDNLWYGGDIPEQFAERFTPYLVHVEAAPIEQVVGALLDAIRNAS